MKQKLMYSSEEQPTVKKSTPSSLEQIENREMGFDMEIKKNLKKFLNKTTNFFSKISEQALKKITAKKEVSEALRYLIIVFSIFSAGDAIAEEKTDNISQYLNIPRIADTHTQKTPFNIPGTSHFDQAFSFEAGKNSPEDVSIPEAINSELKSWKDLSLALSKAVAKVAEESSNTSDKDVFYLSENALDFINDIDSVNSKEEARESLKKKIEQSKINFSSILKIFPLALSANQLSVLVHELGHVTEAQNQGAKEAKIRMGFLSGQYIYKGHVRDRSIISAAGMNTAKNFGDFIVAGLKEDDGDTQFLSLLALAARSNGMIYSWRTLLTKSQIEGDDLVSYSNKIGCSPTELAIGLSAEFIFNHENWALFKKALGKKGVELPNTVISPFINLRGEGSGPAYGLKVKGSF